MTFLIHDVHFGQNSNPQVPSNFGVLETLKYEHQLSNRGTGTVLNHESWWILIPYLVASSSATNPVHIRQLKPSWETQQFSLIHVQSSCPQQHITRTSSSKNQQPPLPQGPIAMCNCIWLTIESLWIPCATLEGWYLCSRISRYPWSTPPKFLQTSRASLAAARMSLRHTGHAPGWCRSSLRSCRPNKVGTSDQNSDPAVGRRRRPARSGVDCCSNLGEASDHLRGKSHNKLVKVHKTLGKKTS